MNDGPRGTRAARSVRRVFKDWESEIARPIIVALFTTVTFFLFALMFAPVRRFLFNDTVPYPIYCTAETYSLPEKSTSARTELLLINTTDRELSRSDLKEALSSGDDGPDGRNPDLRLVYRRGMGKVGPVSADAAFNEDKGEVTVSQEGQDVVVKPQRFAPRAILRVTIEVSDLGADPIPRSAHAMVPFEIEKYERGCYSR